MKIVQIISEHKSRRGVRAGYKRIEAIIASNKRGHHTKHIEVPRDFSAGTEHVVESVEDKNAKRGEARFKLIVKTL